jgi:hypothetical protein
LAANPTSGNSAVVSGTTYPISVATGGNVTVTWYE